MYVFMLIGAINLSFKKKTVDLGVKQVPLATLYTRAPDDGLQIVPKHVEAWYRNKVKK
jgi:hypothetical protein